MPIKKEDGDLGKKTGKTEPVISRDHALIVLLIVCISVALAFDIASSIVKSKSQPSCGDGTFYDSCSLTKPYFCDAGILTEKSSVCACPSGFTISEDSCNSNYKIGETDIPLTYVLNGWTGEIDFPVYDGVATYTSRIPREIYYSGGQEPLKSDFKIKSIDEERQRQFLLPLVADIQNAAKSEDDQARIAISLVQNIPYGFSEKASSNQGVNYSRYPYEVLYDHAGICGEKSALLVFLLKEMGYKTAFFYYPEENHEAVGIGCPVEDGVDNSGYCFVETTGPAILSDNDITYIDGIKLRSKPEVIPISQGKSIDDWKEFKDADLMKKIRGGYVLFERFKLHALEKKYGLSGEYHLA